MSKDNISFYNLTPDFGISKENGEAAMSMYNDIVENDINTNKTWLNDSFARENDTHYKNLSIILHALEKGGRVLRYCTMLLLKMRNVSENTAGMRLELYMDLFYDYFALLTGESAEVKKQEISLMTERERQDFHNSRFIGFLDENCKNTTELVNFDVASVRQCFKYEVVNSNVDVVSAFRSESFISLPCLTLVFLT